ncbi:HNH endonuclease [Pyxidicoccus parkwayensis]|uniref:HNH endonuclease n=1 Tax=Pyxidicoccus parkwayensis TaxID=2813578 RepID=A0ABX7NQJ8_9BACT|nr:HNH endonuclease signature motif containing protein [Pyxidicoccus parkwaysis]QSQ21132.1 HNH endonuclease [Pyxidicoccus parkwaysis]
MSPTDLAVLAVETGMLEVDAFEKLLVYAGLDPTEDLPVRVNPLTPDEAARVLGLLLNKPLTLGNFPPRMGASFLLREVLEGGEVSRQELLRRVERFSGVAVLRPDGYLAWVRNGATQQRVAPVELKDGALLAHQFELGRFYSGRGGAFRLLDARLREANGRVLAEVYDDADVVGRTLDGSEEAFVELYHAMGQFLSHPLDSLAALKNLPAGVAALIASSPEYWERFRYMTAGEQMKAAAKLTASLLVAGSGSGAATRTMRGVLGGAEGMVPVLSLSALGTLALERAAIPAGMVATAVGAGVGSVYVLSIASGGGDPKAEGSRADVESAKEGASRVLGRLWRYPEVIDPRTARKIPFPNGSLKRVPKNQRVSWGTDERAAFIREWYERRYPTPRGGWGAYDIHHIRPRELGGTNDFWNLVPVERTTHQELFNAFWRDYVE